jgi:hypothetical protein
VKLQKTALMEGSQPDLAMWADRASVLHRSVALWVLLTHS